MALSGLERHIRTRFKPRSSSKVNVVAYCDDFIITAATKEILQREIIPMVEDFLKERGLTLSSKKTKITNIEQGFNFLGYNIKKYPSGKLLTTPSAENTKLLLRHLRQTVKSLRGASAERVISTLNSKLRGWCNYFRYGSSSRTFTKVDYHVYQMLARWAYRKHPNKTKSWALRRYLKSQGLRNWVFSDVVRKKGHDKLVTLFYAHKVSILRHIKIRGDAHPFDDQFKEYFKRRKKALNILRSGEKYLCLKKA